MHGLVAEDLAHKYGRHVVFKGVSFCCSAGEAWAIRGANGSGKSTLLKIMAGLLRPTRGSVHLQTNQTVIPRGLLPRHIGLVAPYVNLYEALTLRENLEFIGRIRSLHGIKARICRAGAQVGLSVKSKQALRTYSTGMLQRARFAAALIHDPQILLLDEPTLSLDSAGHTFCIQVVRQVQDSGGIVIIASNAASDIALANKSICIEDYSPAAWSMSQVRN